MHRLMIVMIDMNNISLICNLQNFAFYITIPSKHAFQLIQQIHPIRFDDPLFERYFIRSDDIA